MIPEKDAVSGCEQNLKGVWICRDWCIHWNCGKSGILQVLRPIALSWVCFSLLEQPFLVPLLTEVTPGDNKYKHLRSDDLCRTLVSINQELRMSSDSILDPILYLPLCCFKFALIYDFLCSIKLYQLCETASMSEPGIWGNLSMFLDHAHSK